MYGTMFLNDPLHDEFNIENQGGTQEEAKVLNLQDLEDVSLGCADRVLKWRESKPAPKHTALSHSIMNEANPSNPINKASLLTRNNRTGVA